MADDNNSKPSEDGKKKLTNSMTTKAGGHVERKDEFEASKGLTTDGKYRQ
jgi:hypothetical protein